MDSQTAASSAPLVIGGVRIQAPSQSTDAQAIFAELGSQFQIDAKVTNFLVVDIGVKSLRDFATLFNGPEDIKNIVELVPELEPIKRILQVARLRQAWEGVDEAQRTSEGQKKLKGEDPDLDMMLPQAELDDLTECFWRRHHLSFDSEVMPSDALLSRCSRELQRRLLTVRDVWKVQTLAKELKGDKRTTDLSAGLALVQEVAQPVEKGERTLQRYLDLLWTLMLAYAKAGCKLRPDAPSDGEPFGSASVLYVDVPLDVLMRYHRRAQSFAMKLPPSQALAILTARDEADRKTWVDEFRGSKATLGEVIASTFDKRAGVWIVAPENEMIAGVKRSSPSPRRGGQQRDTAFCAKWNAGGCTSGDTCPMGLKHRCSVVRSNGEFCNLKNHRASQCQHRNSGKGGRKQQNAGKAGKRRY